jgi:hypothetical protein
MVALAHFTLFPHILASAYSLHKQHILHTKLDRIWFPHILSYVQFALYCEHLGFGELAIVPIASLHLHLCNLFTKFYSGCFLHSSMLNAMSSADNYNNITLLESFHQHTSHCFYQIFVFANCFLLSLPSWMPNIVLYAEKFTYYASSTCQHMHTLHFSLHNLHCFWHILSIALLYIRTNSLPYNTKNQSEHLLMLDVSVFFYT